MTRNRLTGQGEKDNMGYKLKKTDGRFTGHLVYDYFIDFTWATSFPSMRPGMGIVDRVLSERQRLNEMRNWCWETFGPGCELETALLLTRNNEEPQWCWRTDHNQLKIYFKATTAEWFTLKWS